MLLTLFSHNLLLQTASGTPGDYTLLGTAITNGSIGIILLVIWFITFKYFSKQNQEQYQHALEQNQEQFSSALKQVSEQHKETITQHEATLNQMFTIMRDDAKYKGMLAEILTRLEKDFQKMCPFNNKEANK